MYIFEVFVKLLNKRQTKEVIPEKPSYEEEDEALTCEHNFMPVDSTGMVLACTKCGFVVKNKDKFES